MGTKVCPVHRAAETAPSLIQNGEVTFQAHYVGWIVSGFFTAVATITSLWLINKHLIYYTNPRQQRYIVRLLFMVPVYAIVTFISYLFYTHASPIVLIRDSYEAVIISAFFYLLLEYIGSAPYHQKEVFRREVDMTHFSWVFPMGWVKWTPDDGFYFLQLMKWGVLQYCVLRPLSTLISVILNAMGLYCEDSWSLGWGHIYLVTVASISVTVAMYCLIQFYMPISGQLAPYKPLLKFFAVKAVIFLTFWQSVILSLLSTAGVIKDQKYMTADDIEVGFSALIQTFEMMLFAFLHVKAFSYLPYRPENRDDHTNRLRSLGHAFDFRDIGKEITSGWVYLVSRLRGVEAEESSRHYHFERVMGQARGPVTSPVAAGRSLGSHVKSMEEVEEEMWLAENGREGEQDIVTELQSRNVQYRDSGDWRAYVPPGGIQGRWSAAYYPASPRLADDEGAALTLHNLGQLDEDQGVSHSREHTLTGVTRRHGPRNFEDPSPLALSPALPHVDGTSASPLSFIARPDTPPLTPPQIAADKGLVGAVYMQLPMPNFYPAEHPSPDGHPASTSPLSHSDSMFNRMFQKSVEQETREGPHDYAQHMPAGPLSLVSQVASFHAVPDELTPEEPKDVHVVQFPQPIVFPSPNSEPKGPTSQESEPAVVHAALPAVYTSPSSPYRSSVPIPPPAIATATSRTTKDSLSKPRKSRPLPLTPAVGSTFTIPTSTQLLEEEALPVLPTIQANLEVSTQVQAPAPTFERTPRATEAALPSILADQSPVSNSGKLPSQPSSAAKSTFGESPRPAPLNLAPSLAPEIFIVQSADSDQPAFTESPVKSAFPSSNSPFPSPLLAVHTPKASSFGSSTPATPRTASDASFSSRHSSQQQLVSDLAPPPPPKDLPTSRGSKERRSRRSRTRNKQAAALQAQEKRPRGKQEESLKETPPVPSVPHLDTLAAPEPAGPSEAEERVESDDTVAQEAEWLALAADARRLEEEEAEREQERKRLEEERQERERLEEEQRELIARQRQRALEEQEAKARYEHEEELRRAEEERQRQERLEEARRAEAERQRRLEEERAAHEAEETRRQEEEARRIEEERLLHERLEEARRAEAERQRKMEEERVAYEAETRRLQEEEARLVELERLRAEAEEKSRREREEVVRKIEEQRRLRLEEEREAERARAEEEERERERERDLEEQARRDREELEAAERLKEARRAEAEEEQRQREEAKARRMEEKAVPKLPRSYVTRVPAPQFSNPPSPGSSASGSSSELPETRSRTTSSRGPSGPARPSEIVLPSPLSPARWGGDSVLSGPQSQVQRKESKMARPSAEVLRGSSDDLTRSLMRGPAGVASPFGLMRKASGVFSNGGRPEISNPILKTPIPLIPNPSARGMMYSMPLRQDSYDRLPGAEATLTSPSAPQVAATIASSMRRPSFDHGHAAATGSISQATSSAIPLLRHQNSSKVSLNISSGASGLFSKRIRKDSISSPMPIPAPVPQTPTPPVPTRRPTTTTSARDQFSRFSRVNVPVAQPSAPTRSGTMPPQAPSAASNPSRGLFRLARRGTSGGNQ